MCVMGCVFIIQHRPRPIASVSSKISSHSRVVVFFFNFVILIVIILKLISIPFCLSDFTTLWPIFKCLPQGNIPSVSLCRQPYLPIGQGFPGGADQQFMIRSGGGGVPWASKGHRSHSGVYMGILE